MPLSRPLATLPRGSSGFAALRPDKHAREGVSESLRGDGSDGCGGDRRDEWLSVRAPRGRRRSAALLVALALTEVHLQVAAAHLEVDAPSAAEAAFEAEDVAVRRRIRFAYAASWSVRHEGGRRRGLLVRDVSVRAVAGVAVTEVAAW